MKRLFFLFFIFFSCKEETYTLKLVKGPYLRNLSSTSASIVFEVETGEKAEIRYGKDSNKLSKIQKGEVRITRYGDVKISTFYIDIADLEPDTTYFYKIKNSVPDLTYAFRTFPEGASFTFVVFGDNRTNLEIFKKIASLIYYEKPLFVIHTGDCVDTGTLYSGMNVLVGWEEFLNTMMPVMKEAPVYIAFGNHEAGGEDFFTTYFPPLSAEFSPFYYSFSTGWVTFFILNSESDLSSSGEQILWLENELSGVKNGSLIGVIHRPPYSSSEHGELAEEGKENEILIIRERLVPIFERYGFKMVFSGHEHNYERTYPIKKGTVDPTGVVYVITGGGGAPLYELRLENPWTAVFKKTYNYVVVNSYSSSFVITAKDIGGKMIDTFEINKE